MTSLKSASKVLLVLAALGLTAVGCERRAGDETSGGGTESSQPGSGSSGSSGMSGSSGSSGSGTSGGSGTYGSGSGGSDSK